MKNRESRVNLALYLGARMLGLSGHNLFLATLFVIAGTGSHASVGLGSLIATTIVAAMIFGIPGGAIADRLGPARGFAMGAGLRSIAIAIVFFGFTSPVSILVIAFLYASVSQLHNPSEMALVKVLCSGAAGRMHSLLVALQYGGQAIGFLVLAPSLYLLGGIQLALGGAVVIVLGQVVVANVLAMRLRGLRPEAPIERRGHFSGVRETLSVFSNSEPARDALAAHAVKSLVAQVILVAFPLYVKHDLSLGTGGAAFLLGPGIAGAVVGLLWGAQASRSKARHARCASPFSAWPSLSSPLPRWITALRPRSPTARCLRLSASKLL